MLNYNIVISLLLLYRKVIYEHFLQVKPDMRLAPSARRELTGELKLSLEQCIERQSADQLYLDQIRSKQVIPQTSSCTWALSDFKDDILILGM
jgi:hypothetical protein